jgi:2-succinyl-5-enolpyruvyl-6-hydroxy-3-cyclohexene-1-carboxylate synthase
VSLGELRQALEQGLASRRSTIIEVRTQREANLGLHRQVADEVAAALRATG